MLRHSLASFVSAVLALVLASCRCNEAPPEVTNENGISEGHMPPELPPMATPSGTSTASAAPSPVPSSSVAAGPEALPELQWSAPQEWRFLGAPSHGPTRAHFYALEEPVTKGLPEHVDVYVIHQIATRGATPEERMKDAVVQESTGFAKVESKEVTTRIAGEKTLTIVELTGVRRELAEDEKTVALPNRMQVSALIPTDGFPVRVAMDGRRDLVERCRAPFFEFVDSLGVSKQ